MWTDGRTDMTKLIVAFRNFANAPKEGKTVPLQAKQSQRVGTEVVLHTQKPKTGEGWVISDTLRPFYIHGTKSGTRETGK